MDVKKILDQATEINASDIYHSPTAKIQKISNKLASTIVNHWLLNRSKSKPHNRETTAILFPFLFPNAKNHSALYSENISIFARQYEILVQRGFTNSKKCSQWLKKKKYFCVTSVVTTRQNGQVNVLPAVHGTVLLKRVSAPTKPHR